MIILHNIHSKKSREFVEKYQAGSTIFDWYNDGMEQWSALGGTLQVSTFPSVVIDIPPVKVSRNDLYKADEIDEGICLDCLGVGPSLGEEDDELPRYTIKKFQWVLSNPKDKNEINDKINKLNELLGTSILNV